MGLLDDAIREHLDLKRARGADPAEVERLEREALGPVRRDPTIGAAHIDAPEHHDERLHQLEDLGYHDSTAPHSESHLDQHAPSVDLQPNGVHATEDEHQPKRRFLRRARPASEPTEQTAGPEAPGAFDYHDPLAHDDLLEYVDPLAHYDLLEHVDPLEHNDPLAYHDPLEHDDQLEHHEPLAQHDPLVQDDLLEHQEPLGQEHATEQHDAAEPPHLKFDAPPARPRFTAEPPAATHPEPAVTGEPGAPRPADPEPPAPANPQSEHHDERAKRHHEPQPTHEFDVPSTFHEEDSEAEAGAEKGEADHEDVLEETPEFLQDTPEHDRLWFEQRPPRDFDFDG
jgi:hypothetical protein